MSIMCKFSMFGPQPVRTSNMVQGLVSAATVVSYAVPALGPCPMPLCKLCLMCVLAAPLALSATNTVGTEYPTHQRSPLLTINHTCICHPTALLRVTETIACSTAYFETHRETLCCVSATVRIAGSHYGHCKAAQARATMSVVYVVLKTHDSTDVERPYLMVVGANRNEVRLQHHHSTTTPPQHRCVAISLLCTLGCAATVVCNSCRQGAPSCLQWQRRCDHMPPHNIVTRRGLQVLHWCRWSRQERHLGKRHSSSRGRKGSSVP